MSGSSDAKISALDSVSTTTGAEILPLVKDGVTKRIALSQIDALSAALANADALTGAEIIGLLQADARRRATSADHVRLVTAMRGGLVFDSIDHAATRVQNLGLATGSAVMVSGYETAGDGGFAAYVKVASEPSHYGKWQDAADNWWELKSLVTRPENFAAKGTGVVDTEALQRTLDFLPDNGTMLLRDNATYGATNLTNPGRKSIIANGLSTIIALDGGDSRYLMAPTGWITNSPYGGAPDRMANVVFDAAGIKDRALIVNAFDSTFNRVECRGAVGSGFVATDTTEDGTKQGYGMGAMRINQCIFRLNGGTGMESIGQTDFIFSDSKSHTNGGRGWSFDGMGGGQLHNLYAFGCDLGCAKFNKFGYGTLIADCFWDGDVEIGEIYNDATSSQVYGPGNIHKNGDLLCSMGGGATSVRLVIDSINLTGSSRIIHGYNGASRKIIVKGGSSAAPNPFVFNTGSSAGTMIVHDHYNRTADGIISGPAQKLATTDTDPIAPNLLYLDKTLAASTTSTVVLTLTVPPDQSAGSAVRIQIDAFSRSAGAVQTYSGLAVANYSRVAASATKGSPGAMFNEVAVGMSAAVVVALASGTTGDHTVTVTVTLTHGTPTAASTTWLRAKVEMPHRYTSAATLA